MPIINLEKEREIVTKGRARGMSDDDIKSAVLQYRDSATREIQGKPKTSFLGNISENIKKRAESVKQTFSDTYSGKISPLETGIQTVGAVGGLVGDIVGETVISSAKAVLPKSIEEKIGTSLTESIQESDIPKLLEAYSSFRNLHPSAAKDLESIVNIADLFGTSLALKGTAKVGAGLAGKAATGISESTAPLVKTLGRGKEFLGELGSRAGTSIKMAPERFTTNLEAMKAERTALESLPDTSQKAVKNGVLLRDVNLASELSPVEKSTAQEMIRSAEEFGTNRAAKDPALVVGNEVEKRISAIDDLAMTQGEKMGKFASELDVDDVSSTPISVLTRLREVPGMSGLNLADGGGLDFSNTSLLSSLSKGERLRISKAFSDVFEKDGLQLYRLRQNLFEILGGKTKANVVLTKTEERSFNAIRQGIADVLEQSNPGYKALSKANAEILEVKKGFDKLYKGIENASGDIRSARGAGLARRLTSNMKSMPELQDLFSKTEAILAEYGVEFGTNIQNLQDVYNAIDRYFDIAKDTGFAGQIKTGVKDIKGVVGAVIEKGKELTGTSENVTRKAFKELFDLQDVPKAPAPSNGAKINFERAKGLTKEDRVIEDSSFQKIIDQEDSILADYKVSNGKIVNTDSFRPVFKDVGYNGSNAAAVQEPASYLAKKAFSNGLKEPGKYATLYAGGSGTGKTSAVNSLLESNPIISESSVILDGNLSSYSGAVKKITEAVEAGKKVPIIYVYRDPVESFTEGVVKRMKSNPKEMGRLVPSKVVAGNHIGSWEVIKKLSKKGADVIFVDNSLGFGKAKLSSLNEMINKIKYPSEKELTATFNKEAKKLYESGQITKEQYEKYIQ